MLLQNLPWVAADLINCLFLGILLFLIARSSSLPATKSANYRTAVLLTMLVLLAEVADLCANGGSPALRWVTVAANVVGFSVSPCIPFVLAAVFNGPLLRRIRHWGWPLAVNGAIAVLSGATGWLFSVSPENVYARGPWFFVYVLAYSWGFVIFVLADWDKARHSTQTERIFLLLLYLFVLGGTTLQVAMPTLRTSWHCVTFALILYYLYQCELQFHYDPVTRLLNRQMFAKKLEGMQTARQCVVIVMDLDNFKVINDSLGHLPGDEYLLLCATQIRDCFEPLGLCYRIGGDEFCVLAEDRTEQELAPCFDRLDAALDRLREADATVPTVSWGCHVWLRTDGTALKHAFQQADAAMYRAKKQRALQ